MEFLLIPGFIFVFIIVIKVVIAHVYLISAFLGKDLCKSQSQRISVGLLCLPTLMVIAVVYLIKYLIKKNNETIISK